MEKSRMIENDAVDTLFRLSKASLASHYLRYKVRSNSVITGKQVQVSKNVRGSVFDNSGRFSINMKKCCLDGIETFHWRGNTNAIVVQSYCMSLRHSVRLDTGFMTIAENW